MPRPVPLAAQFARVITFVQATPVVFAMLIDASILITPGGRPMYWTDFWFLVGGLAISSLAIMSAARLAPGRRWAWCGAMVANAAMALSWVALIVWLAKDTAGIQGTDPGMILLSATFVCIPMIVLSMAAMVLLCTPPVLRWSLASSSSPDDV